MTSKHLNTNSKCTISLGDYSECWYKYIGLQGQFTDVTGNDVSVGGGKNWFIAVNSQAHLNNNHPSSFAGGYVIGSASISFKALGGYL